MKTVLFVEAMSSTAPWCPPTGRPGRPDRPGVSSGECRWLGEGAGPDVARTSTGAAMRAAMRVRVNSCAAECTAQGGDSTCQRVQGG